MKVSLIHEMLQGSRRALSRVLSLVENQTDESNEMLREIIPRTGHALRIGLTGPPGAGKSSLAAAYTKFLRSLDLSVGILAVDPTSPFSGGALLGDRVRMGSLALDAGIFVRSLATRGDLGGLSHAAGDMADILDAAGFDRILLETVGVGQSELEVVEVADTTVVVLVPESGDAIQGMKAGLMEIADIFVINKSDREGADRFAADLRSAMQLKKWKSWIPPIVQTSATRREGISEFHDEVMKHVAFLKSSDLLHERRLERAHRRTRSIIEQKLIADFWTESRLSRLEAAVRSKKTPHEIGAEFLSERNNKF